MPAAASSSRGSTNTALVCAAAWAIPGAGHLLAGRATKGVIFLVALVLMFATGLWLEGELFPFDLSQPLVAFMAFADVGIGVPYILAKATGAGHGRVVAVTYEYANAFLIAAGLLNMLVVLDAYDVTQGRK
jgi:hypothetical protein